MIYDKNNPIYNDICSPYSSKDGVDMILKDLQQEYIDNNKSLCDEDCEFDGYENNQVECNCDIKGSMPPLSEIKIDKDKLYNFVNIKNIANFGVLRCINLFSIKERMIPNIGIYSFIPTFVTYIVCIIVFYRVDFKFIKHKIKDLLYALYNQKYLTKKNKAKHNQAYQPIFIHYARKREYFMKLLMPHNIDNFSIKKRNLNKKNHSSKKLILDDIYKEKNMEENNKSESINSLSKVRLFHERQNNMNSNDILIIKKKQKNAPPRKNILHYSEKIIHESIDKLGSNKKGMILSQKEEKKIKEILAYNDKEINEFTFKSAVKCDKRNYFPLYYSFLKTDHILIKILNSNDYNSRIIKIFLCFYNFSLSYTMNALFFNDDTIHQILEDEGKFNFIYQLPQIIYSSIISNFFCMILDFLALSEDNILGLKTEKSANRINKKGKLLIKTLKIKFFVFFILNLLILFFFWYYLICFCVVYKNTQYHLLKDSLIGFIIGLFCSIRNKINTCLIQVLWVKKKE